MESQRVLILGNGQVARALFRARDIVDTVLLPHRFSDIASTALGHLTALRPDVVINCAAFNSLAAAEKDPQAAYQVNAVGVGKVLEYCDSFGAKLIHFGTNYVFDGEKTFPYTEEDQPNPQTAYGKSKWDGEKQVIESKLGVVLRTSAVWTGALSGFPGWVVSAMRDRQEVQVDDRQLVSFTYVGTLSQVVLCILRRLSEGVRFIESHNVLHVTDNSFTTWYDFAVALADVAGVSSSRIKPYKRDDGIARPVNARLSNRLAAGMFPQEIFRHWRANLEDYLL